MTSEGGYALGFIAIPHGRLLGDPTEAAAGCQRQRRREGPFLGAIKPDCKFRLRDLCKR